MSCLEPASRGVFDSLLKRGYQDGLSQHIEWESVVARKWPDANHSFCSFFSVLIWFQTGRYFVVFDAAALSFANLWATTVYDMVFLPGRNGNKGIGETKIHCLGNGKIPKGAWEYCLVTHTYSHTHTRIRKITCQKEIHKECFGATEEAPLRHPTFCFTVRMMSIVHEDEVQ